MRRFVVVGNSGSGKTTLARNLAAVLEIPHIELDELHHGPDWNERSAGELQALVADAIANAPDGWSMCGNYADKTERKHWRDADTIVWLDYPKWIVMWRVITRTLARVVLRIELWNGNREEVSGLWSRDGIVRWAWDNHRKYHDEYLTLFSSDKWKHLMWVRLRSPRDARRWVRALEDSAAEQ
jgi:adenylate kinase family enzyme